MIPSTSSNDGMGQIKKFASRGFSAGNGLEKVSVKTVFRLLAQTKL